MQPTCQLVLQASNPMRIALFNKSEPDQQVIDQILQLVVENVTDLSMQSVPASNLLHAVYAWTLPCEVDQYIQRIGLMPAAPVELIVAYADHNPAEVIGFLLYLPVPSDADACGINYMVVKQNHRLQGVARAMMAGAIERYPHVELTCTISKVPFYERLNFRVLTAEGAQVVMNTRSASTKGLMGLVNVEPIFRDPRVQAIQGRLVQRWGRKAVLNAEKQLERHIQDLSRKAAEFVQEKLLR